MKTIICEPRDDKPNRQLKLIYGDCLERAGLRIPHKAYAIIERRLDIRVGDLVQCTKVPGTLNSYIKQVKEIRGDTIIVGTAYLDESKDYTFEAADIYGVVVEAYCRLFNGLVYQERK